MPSLWGSPVFGRVTIEPRVLAEDVATDLGLLSSSVLEVVRLHLETLDCALALDAPELLADQLLWQQVRLEAAGATFGPHDVARSIRSALSPLLDDADRRALEKIQNAAAVLGESREVTDALVALGDGPANDYLQATLGGRRDEAIGIIRDALLDDVDAADIMLDILQPAQLELGRLWERGEISIAHEHYTTAITQLSISLLYPRLLLNRTVIGRSLVATTVGGEPHEVGIRMVSDLLEQAGWRTTFLGADLPHGDVIDSVAQHRADVLAVSATMPGQLLAVRELIELLRADPHCQGVRVMVGGRPFAITPRLATELGADGWAPGPREAIELCNSWAGGRVGAG